MDPFLQSAIQQARQGLAEGGIPIGSVLVIGGEIVCHSQYGNGSSFSLTLGEPMLGRKPQL